MQQPFFTIIIPTYNSIKFLKRSLKSIEEQDFNNYEVIVIDDGSNDNTQEFMEEYSLVNNKCLYFYKENGGSATARNLGVSYTKGKYICFLDADDEFMPNKLEEFYKLIEKTNFTAEFIFSDALIIDQNKEVEYIFSSKTAVYSGAYFDKLLKNNFIVNSTVCLSSKLFNKYGGFKSGIRYTEDYELWLRMACNNINMIYCDIPLTKYYYHSEQKSGHKFLMLKDRVYIFKQYFFKHHFAFYRILKEVLLSIMYILKLK